MTSDEKSLSFVYTVPRHYTGTQNHDRQNSNPELASLRTTMQSSFGTQIGGNRRPGAELLVARAGIIIASEAGVLKPKIAAESYVN